MRPYTLRFSQTYVIVLAIVLPGPLMIPFLYFLAKRFPDLDENTLFVIISVFVVSLVASAIWFINRLSPRVEAAVTDHALRIRFTRQSGREREFQIPFNELIQCRLNTRGENADLQIKSNIKPYRFNLSPASKKETDFQVFAAFVEELESAIVRQKDARQ